LAEDLGFELHSLELNRRNFTIKDLPVTQIPNLPGSYDENLYKKE
jgi:hypothetical protein